MHAYSSCKALIIGVGRYADPQYDLSYARADAEAMAELLGSEFGFDQVWTLYDNDATRQNLIRFFEQDLQQTDEDDGLLIFFAGHGITVTSAIGDDRGFLVPHDGNPKQPYSNISLVALRDDYLPMIPAKHVFLIVDSCYGGLALRDVATVERPKTIDDAILAELTRRDRKVRQVLAAGGKNQRVLDGGLFGHSVFTGRLIEALREANPYITADHVGVHVRERVARDSFDRNHRQTPQFGYLTGGECSFVFCRKRTANVSRSRVSIASISPGIGANQGLCPECSLALEEGWKVCPGCGHRLSGKSNTCAGCGSPLKPDWKACPQCGWKTSPSSSHKARRPHAEDVQTCFVESLKANDYETAQDMLDQGADVDGVCKQGYTALWSACVGADVECVRWLLSHGANPNQEGDGAGGTPLSVAAGATIKASKKPSSLEIMKLLIAAGANVNHVHDGLSVWDLAGSSEAQRLLTRSGATKGPRKLQW